MIQQRALLDTYDPNRQIGLILDEWGVWDRIPQTDEQRNGRLWQQATIRSAVAAGLGLNIFNRQADKLYMCNIAQMVNVLQSLILTDGPEGRNCVRTSNYWAFMLFKAASRKERGEGGIRRLPSARRSLREAAVAADGAASRRRRRLRTSPCPLRARDPKWCSRS